MWSYLFYTLSSSLDAVFNAWSETQNSDVPDVADSPHKKLQYVTVRSVGFFCLQQKGTDRDWSVQVFENTLCWDRAYDTIIVMEHL